MPGAAASGRLAALFPALVLMLAVGPTNFVLYKILFSTYGSSSAFFVMQGVNLVYVLYGGVVLFYLRRWTAAITPEMESLPSYPFCVMAALDCLGGLLAAMGAADTPGQLQTLLNQSLVPCTMLTSCIFLGTSYSKRQRYGAAVILCGAAVVVLGLPRSEGDEGKSTIVACLVYWASNIPMSLSAVYKEERFGGDVSVHVMYLTQQVSIYQFLFGFLFAPVESVRTDQTLASVIFRGTDLLNTRNVSLLLLYVLANFVLNVTGLYVTKVGGASLSAITYSVLWPCSTLAFSAPWLGSFREPLKPETLLGLFLVFVGFGLYEFDDVFSSSSSPQQSAYAPVADTPLVVVPKDPQIDAFHERAVLVRVPVTRSESERRRRRTPSLFEAVRTNRLGSADDAFARASSE